MNTLDPLHLACEMSEQVLTGINWAGGHSHRLRIYLSLADKQRYRAKLSRNFDDSR